MPLTSDVQCIGQFNAENIQRIITEALRQQATKRDYVYPAAKIVSAPDGTLVFPDMPSFTVGDHGGTFGTFGEAEAAAEAIRQEGKPAASITPVKGGGKLALSRTAERQLCQRTGVPLDFIDKLRREGQHGTAAELLTARLRDVRAGVDKPEDTCNSDRFLVRTLDNRVRAILSPSYRIIDNADLFFACHDSFEKAAAELWQLRMSDDSFELLAVSKNIRGDVRTDRTFNPGDGWESRWANLGGDTQYAAISISNSETGGGAVRISPAVMTRVCANFCVWGKTVRQIHVQRSREADGLVESAEINAAESRLVWLKVRNAIETVFNPDRFAAYIESMNDATQQALPQDVKALTATVENVAERYAITDDRKESILKNLFESRDYSRYGLVQAVTYEAHAADRDNAADAGDFETIGGELLTIGKREFAELVG